MKKGILFKSLILGFMSIILIINPRKLGLFEECKGATNHAKLFMILIRHRESKKISDGKKITEVTII